MTGAAGPGRYRPEFAAALDLLARAMTELRRRGAPFPVLVGGAEFAPWVIGATM